MALVTSVEFNYEHGVEIIVENIPGFARRGDHCMGEKYFIFPRYAVSSFRYVFVNKLTFTYFETMIA